jgi:hypothetical protein
MSAKRKPDHLKDVAAEMLSIIGEEYADDIDAVLLFLREAADGKHALKRLMKYKVIPISPREFVESPEYMDAKDKLYPVVMDAFIALNSGGFVESVLTGGIGSGKTTLGLYTQAYQIYLLSCLRDPHAEFGLDNSSEITIVFQSLNEKLAKAIDYERFRTMMAKAPYFKHHFPYDASLLSEMRFPNRIIVKPLTGSDTAAIGQNVIGGIIDEVDFQAVIEKSKASRDGTVYDQAAANYNAITRRRESRFMKQGNLPGMVCLISSKNYPGGMTDRKQEEARTNPRIFVYDRRVWEIKPDDFTGEWFKVFIGDESRKARMLADDDPFAVSDEKLVIRVPEEFRKQFEGDLIKSIRDIAGYSTQALYPYMLNTEAVASCFGKVKSIASRPDCDFNKTRIDIFPGRFENQTEPRFAHIDLSISKDSAGIAICHVPKFVHMNRGNFQETLPLIQFDLLLEVQPPKGGEIIFDNIRRLFYVLRDQLRLPIKWVSFDSFQSTDSQQIMHREGFMVGYQSMDTDTEAYDCLKTAFYDQRIHAPHHAKAQKEVSALEYDAKKQKIDHTPQGSKDIADAMAGAAYGITMRREIWLRHNISLSRIPEGLNIIHSKNSVTAKEREPEAYMDKARKARGVAVGVRNVEQDGDE